MAIIGETVELTLDQKKAIHKKRIVDSVNRTLELLKAQFRLNMGMVWNNGELTPQQVFDAFGADAVQLFVIAGALQDAVNSVAPGSLPDAPPYQYTLNQDGTVTVGDPV